MCTVAIYARVWERFPLVLVGNRDEFSTRGWREPGAHWRESPALFAPKDCVSGGSWLGVNGAGLACTVLNQGRTSSVGRDRRSRGELVISALAAGSLDDARRYAESLDASDYLGFHLLLADAGEVCLVSSAAGGLQLKALPAGVHLLSSRGVNDDECPKSRRLLARMRAQVPAQPDRDRWRFARALLSTRAAPGQKDGFWIELGGGYGTRSSAIVAVEAQPHTAGTGQRWHFWHSRPEPHPQPPLPLVEYQAGAIGSARSDVAC
ncbi:MAG: NRDE family protein [Haliangiales bacterium]